MSGNRIPLPCEVENPTGCNLSTEPTPEGSDFLAVDKWFDVDISKDYLDFTKPYEKPHKTLSMDGIPFAPLKGIHALTGQSGHGKTMLFTQFMAAILSGEFGGYVTNCPTSSPDRQYYTLIRKWKRKIR